MQHKRNTRGRLDVFDTLDVDGLHRQTGNDAMHNAHGNRQIVDAGFRHKTTRLFHIGVIVFPINSFAHIGDLAQLRLDRDAKGMRDFNNLAGGCDIFLKWQMRAIVHHRGKPKFDGGHHLVPRSMIQMDHILRFGTLGNAAGQLKGAGHTHMRDDRAAHLQENRRSGLFGRPNQRLGSLIIVHVEGTDSIIAITGGINQGAGVGLQGHVGLRYRV